MLAVNHSHNSNPLFAGNHSPSAAVIHVQVDRESLSALRKDLFKSK